MGNRQGTAGEPKEPTRESLQLGKFALLYSELLDATEQSRDKAWGLGLSSVWWANLANHSARSIKLSFKSFRSNRVSGAGFQCSNAHKTAEVCAMIKQNTQKHAQLGAIPKGVHM